MPQANDAPQEPGTVEVPRSLAARLVVQLWVSDGKLSRHILQAMRGPVAPAIDAGVPSIEGRVGSCVMYVGWHSTNKQAYWSTSTVHAAPSEHLAHDEPWEHNTADCKHGRRHWLTHCGLQRSFYLLDPPAQTNHIQVLGKQPTQR